MTKKYQQKQDYLRERIYQFYCENRSKGKLFTFNHFSIENIPKTTIYRNMKRQDNHISPKRIIRSGRIARKMTIQNLIKLKRKFNNNDKVSVRQAGRKFNCHLTLIHKTLKKHTKIRFLKKKKTPKRSLQQQKDAKLKCGKLLTKYKKRDWVIDDESYFTLSHSLINGNGRFYTSNIETAPPDIKFNKASKYESKILVWICISFKGISSPLFLESGLAINQQIYLDQCIKKRLIPFLKKYYSDQNYFLWPDKASSHYVSSVINYLDEKQVSYVAKEENPTNMPEGSPIEDFWAILKGLVYKGNWQAQSIEKLQTIVK